MSQTHGASQRITFAKQPFKITPTDLLSFQLTSFQKLYKPGSTKDEREQEKLYQLFQEHFPIADPRENFKLEFLDYHVGTPYHTPAECLEQGITYDAPLKASFRLSCKEADQETRVVEEELFIADLPYMTPQGSFIINGIERVVISQIQRSYGLFFSQTKHTSGAKLYTAKIVPMRGTWIEFSIDAHNVMYAYLDRRKKIPATLVLRALGYSSDKEILDLFDLCEEVEATAENLQRFIGRRLGANIVRERVEEYVQEETGELIPHEYNDVLVKRHTVLSKETVQEILSTGEKTIMLYKESEGNHPYEFIYNTLKKDDSNNTKEANEQIYFALYGVEAPDEDIAAQHVFQIFFNEKRTYMGPIGRYSLNKKLGLDIAPEVHTLTKEDVIELIKKFANLMRGEISPEDPDSMASRILQLPGDQLTYTFERGLKLMARSARETLNSRSSEELAPVDLVTGHALTSSLNIFFGTNPNSQFMDQVNPLSEVAHKQRSTKTSERGLTRERAGFEARDVHSTHYSRLCVVQSPEGLGIGLTPALALYTVVDEMGFLQAPYKKVTNGKVDLSDTVHYLAAEEEEEYVIGQITSEIAPDGTILAPKIKARVNQGDLTTVTPGEVDYIDIAYDQIVSISAALIPYLEHDDATRALMGSNMQRQAVPLLQPEAPIVGTGKEAQVVRDSRVIPAASQEGVVEYVDARKIVLSYHLPPELESIAVDIPKETFHLPKMVATNQSTCVNLKPIVKKGDQVSAGQLLCEGYSTQDGELALGKNLRVAFMSYKGYNFEDGIVVSDRLVKEDVLTSIHIEEFKVDAYQTKLGPEEFTADIPNLSEKATQHLDENGVVRIGREVKEGDILVGKITPQSEVNHTPENKLFQAIFGEKFSSVKDTSLRAPTSLRGTVIKTKLSSVPVRDKAMVAQLTAALRDLKKKANQKLDSIAEKGRKILEKLLDKQTTVGVYDINGQELMAPGQAFTSAVIRKSLFIDKRGSQELEKELNPSHLETYEWTTDSALNEKVKFFFTTYHRCRQEIVNDYKRAKKRLEVGDDLGLGVIQHAKVFVAKKRKIQVGDKLSGRHGNKGIVTKIAREEDMPYDEDGRPIDIILNQHGIPSRMNLGQVLEALLGWAGAALGEKYAIPIFQGAGLNSVHPKLAEAGLPPFGRLTLYDGLTGEKFDHPVTVGVLYMLKLNHLVEAKMHARCVGPYKFVTQQPLGGRSRRGGQRFGEMEVWTGNAYPAPYLLQEMLTIKSDDIEGRQKAYEAIVKGNNLPRPSRPESFKVLLHLLRAASVEVTLRDNKKK